MTWKIRHQGSPQSVDGLSVPQVVEGLQDGLWEPTDEVMGPADQNWVALENHPQFADLAADLEPAPPPNREDETRLDMNPLIDVCLVLLIFFILTTTYAALEKVLDTANVSTQEEKGPPQVTKEKVEQFMIQVKAQQENGQTVIRVENEVTDPENLVPALKRYVSKDHKTELLIVADRDVDWGTVVMIQDAGTGAGVRRVHLLEKPK